MKITPQLKIAVEKAINEAEKRTLAEIFIVLAPASDPYQSQVMLCGLVLGSVITLALWFWHILIIFPALLMLQLGLVALFLFVPQLHGCCFCLVPKQIMRRKAARRAYEEYIFASRHVPSNTPVVLLYVSLAEKYAHILHSRAVAAKIPEEVWDKEIAAFTAAVKEHGLEKASADAAARIADILAPHFPEPK
jgi:putative membrane protein